MRFLCLHGSGTNSEVLQFQTATLRHHLGLQHTFEFVDGTIDCPQEYQVPGIKKLFPELSDFYLYFDPANATSIRTAVDDVRSYVADEGPFDGVLGFSQGATLAATLVAAGGQSSSHNDHSLVPASSDPLFKLAILISGNVAFDYAALIEGEVRVLAPTKEHGGSSTRSSDVPISIPTTHIFGLNDTEYLTGCRALSELCSKSLKVEYVHAGGHEIPTAPREIVDGMVEAIQQSIDRALLLQ